MYFIQCFIAMLVPFFGKFAVYFRVKYWQEVDVHKMLQCRFIKLRE